MPLSVKLQTTHSLVEVLEMKPEYLAQNQLCLKPACGLLNICEPKYFLFFFFSLNYFGSCFYVSQRTLECLFVDFSH